MTDTRVHLTEPIPGLPIYLTFAEIKHLPDLTEIFRQATEEVAEGADPETIATRIKRKARFANFLFEQAMNYRYITQSGDSSSLISASQPGWINITVHPHNAGELRVIDHFLSAHDELYDANALDAETNRPILLVSSIMDETFECRRTAKRVFVVPLHRIGSLEDLHDW